MSLLDYQTRLRFERDDGIYAGAMTICSGRTLESLRDGAQDFLHEAEQSVLGKMKYERRQFSYLSGRFALKEALSLMAPSSSRNRWHVASGVFGQPYLKMAGGSVYDVSISHCQDVAMALAVEPGHPVAVDVEILEKKMEETLCAQVLDGEWELPFPESLSEAERALVLWTAKEALSKILKTGMMVPFELYETTTIATTPYGLSFEFKNFAQYKAEIFFEMPYCFAMAYPEKSRLNYNPILPVVFQGGMMGR